MQNKFYLWEILNLTVWKRKLLFVTAMWRPYHFKNNSYPNTITFCRKTAPRLSNEARIVRGLERKQGFADWFGYVF